MARKGILGKAVKGGRVGGSKVVKVVDEVVVKSVIEPIEQVELGMYSYSVHLGMPVYGRIEARDLRDAYNRVLGMLGGIVEISVEGS